MLITAHAQSHSSIVDKDGMAVALTTTVNLVFGSAVMDPITGVILNDEVGQPPFCYISSRLKCFTQMDDFSTPGTPNAFGLYPSPCECDRHGIELR